MSWSIYLYLMILPRNFKVSGFSGAKMQMMSLCVKISSKDLDTILCFRQESVEDHEEHKEGFLTGFWQVSDRFLMGFFVSFGKTPIATYSYCHHLSDSFPLPDATNLFQVAHRVIPDRLVVDPWRMHWEYNENAMSKCHFWSEYIWIKQCKTWIGLLDCLAELLKVSFCPHLSMALFIHHTVSEVDGSQQRYLSLIYIYLL